MLSKKNTSLLFTFFIAAVWIANGLFCKVLGWVPRHEEIVQTILCLDRPSAYFLTKAIGTLEIGMSIWILSRFKTKLNAILQIIIIATMNILELILVPNLLLWGEFNLLFAILFMLMIYCNAFYLKPSE